MKIFNNQKNQEITQLLKDSSELEFHFDQPGLKNRLNLSMTQTNRQVAVPPRFFETQRVKYSLVAAGGVIFLSATFAVASTAQPGDKLFALNKFGEHFILSLPLSAQTKANLETSIVTKRLNALSKVQATDNNTLQTVKESDESLKAAIDNITANKAQLIKSGQVQTAQKLDSALTQLEGLARQHETQIEALEAATTDEGARKSIDQHLSEIKNAHHRARLELNLKDSITQ